MVYVSKIDRFERKSSKSKENKFPEFSSNPGTPIRELYEYKIVDGVKQLVKSGKVENTQDFIDSFKDTQNINNMISRFLSGDDSVMNPNTGVYGDFTNFPKTYAELFERVQECENVFKSMPKEIKEAFDNSSSRFWSDFGNDYFNDVFDKFNKKSVPTDDVKESEVVENAE